MLARPPESLPMATIQDATRDAAHQLWVLLSLNLQDFPALAASCLQGFSEHLRTARCRLILVDAEFQVFQGLPLKQVAARARYLDERVQQLYDGVRHSTGNLRSLLEDCLRLPAPSSIQHLLGDALQELTWFVHNLWNELRKWRELRLQLGDYGLFRDHF